MSLCALTLCCEVKIVRVIRVESWGVSKYLRNGLENSNQTLHTDRHYGSADARSQKFMILRIGAVWARGKVYGFLLTFHMVDCVLALRAAAKRM